MGRSDTIITHRIVPKAVVCVPESEAGEYRAKLQSFKGIGVEAHPDSVVGLYPKRNWIIDNLADRDGVVQLDDDIDCVRLCYVDPGEKPNVTRDPEHVRAIIFQTWRVAREMGVFLFGWASGGASNVFYLPMSPFSLTGYINGCASGLINGSGLRFDERLKLKGDFDLCCQNLHRHRMCFRDERFQFNQKGTFKSRGGLAAHRTSASEQQSVELLQRKWGKLIRVGDHLGVGHRKASYAGVRKVGLVNPF